MLSCSCPIFASWSDSGPGQGSTQRGASSWQSCDMLTCLSEGQWSSSAACGARFEQQTKTCGPAWPWASRLGLVEFCACQPWPCRVALCQSCGGSVDLQVTRGSCQHEAPAGREQPLAGGFHQEPEAPAGVKVELGGDMVRELGMLAGTS